ncbi:MAG: Rid family detoxifying hydrolase [Candidatus Omnitrophota bacterium]
MNDFAVPHPKLTAPTSTTDVQLMNDIPDVPKAVGPYSQIAIAGDKIYLSGQLPLDPKTGKLVSGTIEEQTEQVFNNIEAVLKGVGLGLTDVARSSVYLTDMSTFPNMNAIYAKRFGDHKPARETIGVCALALGAAVEITVIAHKRKE